MLLPRYIQAKLGQLTHASTIDETFQAKFSERYRYWWWRLCGPTRSPLAGRFQCIYTAIYVQKCSAGRAVRGSLWQCKVCDEIWKGASTEKGTCKRFKHGELKGCLKQSLSNTWSSKKRAVLHVLFHLRKYQRLVSWFSVWSDMVPREKNRKSDKHKKSYWNSCKVVSNWRRSIGGDVYNVSPLRLKKGECR